MQKQKIIERLGYSKNEARVYLAVLTGNEVKVSDIAIKTGIPRSTVQLILDKLSSCGLINFFVIRNHK